MNIVRPSEDIAVDFSKALMNCGRRELLHYTRDNQAIYDYGFGELRRELSLMVESSVAATPGGSGKNV
jgi:hypothetical protein